MRPEESHQKTVLVVEDDPWTRTVTTALLAGEGYAVVEARNGEEGLELASVHTPDVVLLDLALPAKSGLEVLRELKTGSHTSTIPVIVVSAYGSLMKDEDSRHAEAVIEKPFDYDELVHRVERASEPFPALATVAHR
jgi:DNA-binding response OmpR family regulator